MFGAGGGTSSYEEVENADLIVVSHSMSTIKAYCDRGAVLVDGQMMMFESVDKAIEVYNRLNR